MVLHVFAFLWFVDIVVYVLCVSMLAARPPVFCLTRSVMFDMVFKMFCVLYMFRHVCTMFLLCSMF